MASSRPELVLVGPGAVGCLFAAILARSGVGVALLDYRPERACRIRRRGILLETGSGVERVDVPISTEPLPWGQPALVCLCVKAYQTSSAIAGARPLVGRDTTVVSLQNGLDNAQRIAAAVPDAGIACAATSRGATVLEEGRIRPVGSGDTLVAPFTPGAHSGAVQFVSLLAGHGIAAEFHPDAATVLWSKLVVNAAVNPVTAIADVPNGTVLERDDLWQTAQGAAREAARVARDRGVELLYDDPVAEVRRVCEQTHANLSSMLQDIRAGRRTEIDAITGALVREAAAMNVAAPLNAELLRKVKAREAHLARPAEPA